MAEMLNTSFECIYATLAPSKYQISEIYSVCHKLVSLSEGTDHFSEFLDLINGDEIVVLDNYFFSTDYQEKIRSKGSKLVCIDDMHDKRYVADVVINHAPGLCENDFDKEAYTKLFLGPEYTLVRQVFREHKIKVQKVKSKPENLMILFGGADFYNLSLRYLKKFHDMESFSKIHVITGDGYRYKDELVHFTRNTGTKNIIHHHSISAAEIIKIAAISDLALVPASTVLFELLTLRLPVISGYYIENQRKIFEGFADLDVIFKAYDLNDESNVDCALADISINSINTLLDKQKQVIDNKSAIRINDIFCTL